ncbi:MAG: SHOCT domain-containing protein, partial [Burkholderiales bacterium]|nr:SHOCT domain-containing protein [Burkholderiales bacterium]
SAAPAALPVPLSAPPQAAPAPAPKPLDAAGAADIERRLETLKRLHDKGLITDDEYRQKRKEILQLL